MALNNKSLLEVPMRAFSIADDFKLSELDIKN